MKRYEGKPIIFSTSMILAILERRKMQTRRVVRPQPEFVPPRETARNGLLLFSKGKNWQEVNIDRLNTWITSPNTLCPYWSESRVLWVREAYRLGAHFDPGATTSGIFRRAESIPGGVLAETCRPTVRYEADGSFNHEPLPNWKPGKLHPSIFMPHWAHRIDLELTGIRIEQVQDISMEDCLAEGITYEEADMCGALLEDCYADLWDYLNLKRGFGFDANPWVWVLEFQPSSVLKP
jgi:hypothetical protein